MWLNILIHIMCSSFFTKQIWEERIRMKLSIVCVFLRSVFFELDASMWIASLICCSVQLGFWPRQTILRHNFWIVMHSPAHRSSHICSSGIWLVASECSCLKVWNFCAFLVQVFGVSCPHTRQGIAEALLEVRLILDFFILF